MRGTITLITLSNLSADIDILADELDAVVKSPGLKKTIRKVKGDMKRGKLF